MTPSLSLASESSPIHSGKSHLSYDNLKTQFPLVLDVRADCWDKPRPVDMSIVDMFQTDSTALADASTLPKIIGRTYFLKCGKSIELSNVKSYLRRARKGSEETPVPLNQLGKLVSNAIQALSPTPAKKSPYLTFINLQTEFPHLFEADSRGRLKINTRKTAVDAWFETTKTSLVDPAALTKIIGRAFYLKHRKPVNPRHINAYLNGSAETPVPLNELGQLVSEAIAELIKGPTERPEPAPRKIPAERIPFHNIRNIGVGFELKEGEKIPREESIHQPDSTEFIVKAAIGHITPLKGTAPDKAKGSEKEICARVFRKMHGKHPVDNKMLLWCITAAWDRLSINWAGYEGDKKSAKPLGLTKPLNVSLRGR